MSHIASKGGSAFPSTIEKAVPGTIFLIPSQFSITFIERYKKIEGSSNCKTKTQKQRSVWKRKVSENKYRDQNHIKDSITFNYCKQERMPII
jgi:hypothetical protein